MRRRVFLTKGTAGVFALGAFGCSKNDPSNTLAPSSNSTNISGNIVDPEGNGVQGVSVKLAGSEITMTTYTDNAGEFSFKVTKNCEYTIHPSKSGYKFDPVSQKIAVNGSQSFVVNIIAIIINSGGEIDTTELGTTGIMVSKFGFGSHVQSNNTGDKREYMIHEAFDRGINIFEHPKAPRAKTPAVPFFKNTRRFIRSPFH